MRDFGRWNPHHSLITEAFDKEALRKVCAMDEEEFGDAYGLTRWVVEDLPTQDNFYFYKDNGSSVLAVAHLDTVAHPGARKARFVTTEDGLVVFSRALDDRLGAYIILELLPALGIQYDLLLTVGEEQGQSTAEHFVVPDGKEYDWMIEFDRGGTDVVMYQYDDKDTRALVRECGAHPADGAYSDISYLGHVGAKGFNWGVGYEDYHGPRSHAFLEDTFEMVGYYLNFHELNEGTRMPHVESTSGWSRFGRSSLWDDDAKYNAWLRETGCEHEGERAGDICGECGDYVPDDADVLDYTEHPSLAQVNAAIEAMDQPDQIIRDAVIQEA